MTASRDTLGIRSSTISSVRSNRTRSAPLHTAAQRIAKHEDAARAERLFTVSRAVMGTSIASRSVRTHGNRAGMQTGKSAVADVLRLRAPTRSVTYCEEKLVDGRKPELPTSAMRTSPESGRLWLRGQDVDALDRANRLHARTCG